MELDSLIRICYIKSLRDENEKNTLLTQFFDGQRWKLEKNIISDRKMVTYVTNNLGLGWADPIYDIGCAFIHLSPYHDYMSQNPTSTLSRESRQTIIKHVKDHHHIDMII
ncbi:MAG: hypothetical protein PHY83_03595 [Bacilli bacterium]|nr:hypothetical protein [Bacilli bacterium]MDD3085189.1 hypothetical protein [Candidatus ainarchaeum sp.]